MAAVGFPSETLMCVLADSEAENVAIAVLGMISDR